MQGCPRIIRSGGFLILGRLIQYSCFEYQVDHLQSIPSIFLDLTHTVKRRFDDGVISISLKCLVYLFDGIEILEVMFPDGLRHGAVGVGVEVPRYPDGYPDQALLYAAALVLATDILDFNECDWEPDRRTAFEIIELAFLEVCHPDLGNGGQEIATKEK